MQIIDFHNHFYPREYIDAVVKGPSSVKVTFDDAGNPLLHYPGDYNILVPGHRDIAYRRSVIEKAGVDMQVLTFTSPGTHVESPETAVKMARDVNDAFSRIVQNYGSRYTSLATLPLNDPDASVTELDRAVNVLGFRGAMVFSNVNGTALSDEQYMPLWKKANELEAVVYIHPIHPVGVEAMTEYWLTPLVGFVFDTSLTAAKLVFSGIVERLPQITWVLGHLGGAIPYIAERLDRGYLAFKECRKNITKPPSEYLKNFYFDTVNFDLNALKLAIEFAGADHLLAGSDYPHQIGSIEKMIASINALPIPPKDKEAIFGGNAKKLLEI